MCLTARIFYFFVNNSGNNQPIEIIVSKQNAEEVVVMSDHEP